MSDISTDNFNTKLNDLLSKGLTIEKNSKNSEKSKGINYFKIKTTYMRKVYSSVFYFYLISTALMLPDVYFVSVIIVLVLGLFVVCYYDVRFDNTFYNPLNTAHHKLSQRYIKMLEERLQENEEQRRIVGMLETLEENIDFWPPDKSSRWLGFVQSYMIKENYTTVQEERDFSRPLFHNAYKELGYTIPKSISI